MNSDKFGNPYFKYLTGYKITKKIANFLVFIRIHSYAQT